MESESDKGGEGGGLPVGFAWRPEGKKWMILVREGAHGEVAQARNDGRWLALKEKDSRVIATDIAKPSGEMDAWAAAQAAAEAALWATDGYGTGEVRGVRLSLLDISDAAALVASRQTVALPGLSGWWIVRAARCDGGAEGVEVDAVRAPAPVDKAARAWASIRQIADDGSHPADAPVEPVIEAGPFCAWDLCRAPLSGPPRPGCGSPYQHDADDDEPAHREPPAPTDGAELARLLPGLDDILTAMRVAHEAGWEDGPDPDMVQLRRACELLLAERERASAILQALFSDVATPIELATHTTELLEEAARETDALRARAEEAERRVVALAASPPPGTVAALLAKVEEARAEKAATGIAHDDREHRIYASGMAGGLYAAADLIRATLGAPTPLDGVAAEVCAVDVADAVADTFDAWAALGDICRAEADGLSEERTQFAKAGRVALAGMLACDAAKGGARG